METAAHARKASTNSSVSALKDSPAFAVISVSI